jgi:hypothetical protein
VEWASVLALAQEQAHTQVEVVEAGAAAKLVAHMWMMVAVEVAEVAELAAQEMAVSPPQQSARRNWNVDAARSLQHSAMPSLLAAEVVDPNQSACPRCILPGFLHQRRGRKSDAIRSHIGTGHS